MTKFDEYQSLIKEFEDDYNKSRVINMLIGISTLFEGNERRLLIDSLYHIIEYHSKLAGVLNLFNKVNRNLPDYIN